MKVFVKGYTDHNRTSRKKSDPNPDLETETRSPMGHCEHLQGACLHAEVLSFAGARQAFWHAGVAISLKKARLLRFTRNDNF
jgi:hypothetical protein